MSRKYRIGFYVGMLFLVAFLVIIYQISYQTAQKEQEQKIAEEKVLQTEGKAYKEDGYMITEKDGYVIVYYSDMKTVYEYTSIQTKHLPEKIHEKLLQGIYAESIKEVYGFLENYSS